MTGYELMWLRYLIVLQGLFFSQLASGEKTNRCPRPVVNGSCVESCTNDENCPGTHKCCFNGCGHACTRPVVDATSLFLEPDFVSQWYNMTAQPGEATTLLNIEHGLGETPLLVDVQVTDNTGFIFPGSGCRIRDDDELEDYGGIVYLYNDVYIEISSPTDGNSKMGRIIYTGIEPYWTGAYDIDTHTAMVRARAWRVASLPDPDSVDTQIPITSQYENGSYVEKSHGLGEIPALVISRLKFPSNNPNRPNYYSDSIGATLAVYDNCQYSQNSFVVHGLSSDSIRAWAPSLPGNALFKGGDGWNFKEVEVFSGELEFYSWTSSTLSPAQATGGPNDGFRFVGSGNLAYEEDPLAAGCTYGGLVYAYSEQGLRFWRPGPGTNESNGALICVPDNMGGGMNVQSSTDGQAVYNVWSLDHDDCSPDPCVNGYFTNFDGGYNCTCDAGYEGTDCESDIDECLNGTDNCDVNANCTNTLGSFTCVCNAGFVGDGTVCTDIDECLNGTDNCAVNANCTNTPGSYTCACNAGFKGDGTVCTVKDGICPVPDGVGPCLQLCSNDLDCSGPSKCCSNGCSRTCQTPDCAIGQNGTCGTILRLTCSSESSCMFIDNSIADGGGKCCFKPKPRNVCTLPKKNDPSPCKEPVERFYYDPLKCKCKSFIYNECKGNSNNFLSKNKCKKACGDTKCPVCSIPKDPGPCTGSFRHFFFNIQTCQCEEFIYGGCGGNENRYETKQDCEEVCDSIECPVCNLPSKNGECKKKLQRWYFDSVDCECKTFWYGGCGGNMNRFMTEQDCKGSCGSFPCPVCSLPMKVGPCSAAIPRFYYNPRKNKCKEFSWGGCQPNGNNFRNRKLCNEVCKNFVCSLPVKVGPCEALVKRYYFDTKANTCLPFFWGGCQKNENNFKTLEACKRIC